MNWLRRISRLLIMLALFGMIGVAGIGFFALRGDVQTLQRLSLERIEWKSAQIETEFARLNALVSRHVAGDPEVGPGEVIAGLARLESRIESYLNGSVGARIASYDRDGTLTAARALLVRYGTLLQASGAIPEADTRRLQRELSTLAEPLSALSRAVVWGEEMRFHEIRSGLRQSSEMTLTLCLAAMVLAAALIAALTVELQRHRRESRANLALANRATAASQAKSRFLTMMSHELRTPMNGVLGLVALARQSGLTEAQERLLDHADRSGRQMMAQLTDILDFAELDSDRLALDSTPFTLGDLAAALGELIRPLARRGGAAFAIDCPGGGDVAVASDLPRLRQIVRHLTLFLLDRVAVRDLTVTLTAEEGRLAIALEADEPEGGATGWPFEAALGPAGDGPGAIESDAFGPAIARALIARFGGTLELRRPAPGRARLVAAVPVETLGRSRPPVRVEVGSGAMRTVCVSLLTRLGLPEWDPGGSIGRVGAILVEGDGAGISAAALRRDHPGARIIAIGAAAPGLDCDAALPYPPSLEQFRSALGSGAAAALPSPPEAAPAAPPDRPPGGAPEPASRPPSQPPSRPGLLPAAGRFRGVNG